jgi:hypothetical protein
MAANLGGNGAWRYGKPEHTSGAESSPAPEAAAETPDVADSAAAEAPADESPADAQPKPKPQAWPTTPPRKARWARMNNNPYIDDTLFEQIMEVRSSGQCNMLDATAVQRYAYDHDLFKLVTFIEEHKREYAEFILHGKR